MATSTTMSIGDIVLTEDTVSRSAGPSEVPRLLVVRHVEGRGELIQHDVRQRVLSRCLRGDAGRDGRGGESELHVATHLGELEVPQVLARVADRDALQSLLRPGREPRLDRGVVRPEHALRIAEERGAQGRAPQLQLGRFLA